LDCVIFATPAMIEVGKGAQRAVTEFLLTEAQCLLLAFHRR
jgi:hypothetical protein